MKEQAKTKGQLIKELQELQQRITDLEKSEIKHKQAEKKLRESEEEFRNLFENAKDGLIFLDKLGRILKVNERAVQIFGGSRKEVLGKHFIKLGVFPLNVIPLMQRVFKEALTKKKFKLNDICIKNKRGEEIHLECSATSIKKNNKIKGLLVIVRDITQRKFAEDELRRHRRHLETLIEERTAEQKKTNEQLQLEISERKRAEDVLRESERRFRSVVENSHDGILIVDDAYRLIYANNELYRIVGYPLEEIIGQDFRKFLDEESKQLVVNRYIQRQRGKKVPPRYEFNIVRKDGKKRRVEVSSTILKNSNGKVKTVAQVLDITERNQIEEALRQSEEKFRTISSSALDGIIMTDNNGNISYWNDATENVFGYTKEEAYGKHMKIIIPEKYHEAYKKGFRRFKTTGKGPKIEKTLELTGRRKDGTEFPLELSLASVKIKNKWNALGIVRDITDRKRMEEALRQSEKRFKELWNNAPVAYHTLDTKGTITSVNQTELKMLGYSYKEMVGKPIFEFILSEQQAEAQKRFKQKISGKHIPRAENRIYLKKDGSKLYVMIDDVLEYDDDGKITGIKTTMVDITNRKQMEEALQENKERYKALFDRSLYCVYVHDFEGKFLDANKAALSLLGYTKKDIPSLNFSSLLDKNQLAIAVNNLEELKRAGYQKNPSKFKLRKKDGEFVWVETEASVIYRNGKPYAIQGIARDITEPMKAGEALQESKEKYRTLAENAMDGIYIISPEGFEYVNPAFEKILGYRSKEVCNKDFNFVDLIHPEDRKLVWERENGRKKGKKLPPKYSFRILTKSGKTKYVEVNTISLPGERVRVLGILRDITKRMRAEEALRESEERYKTLVQTSPDAVTVTDLEGNITYVSQQTLKLHGFKSAKEVLGKSAFDFIAPEHHEKAIINLQKTLKDGNIRDVEYTLLKKDGTRFIGELSSALIKDADGNPKMFIATTRDITERKRAEEIIKESKERYRDLVEKAGVAILIDDKEANIKYCNNKFAEMFGYSVEEIKKMKIQSVVHPDDAEKVTKFHKGRIQGKKVPSRYECRGVKKDGSVINIEINAEALKNNGNIIGTRSYMWDVTERKQTVEAMQASEQKFKTLFDSASDAIFIHDLDGKLLEVNQVACKRLGYNREKILQMSLSDIDRPKQAASIPERIEELYNRGHIFFETAYAHRDGTVIPIELSSRIIEYEGKPAALSIARDITERKLAEEERKQSFGRLRKALEETVNALASAVEMRDPYTAGHQHRVTSLACAIAKEMGLPSEKIDGIHMAGVIHDVGKIRVPAEILSWPGRLTDIDFNVIKTHPQVGYDILKTIELPYSVAKIMLQHHERMDGSGYPAGLKGEEILIEARILAVADVVEAMASHRPYRAALGIEKALDEISRNKGILYDAEVVEACLRLFKDKKFKFK